jgi:hypothetical protein
VLTTPSPGADHSLSWLFDVLFSASPSTTWAGSGALPGGFERADQFAVLPAGRDRKFVVSLASRRASSAALTAYNALRPGRTRLARRMLGVGLRAGLSQPFIRDRIDVGIAAGLAGSQLAAEVLTEHLGQLLGCERVVLAFGAGAGPYRKPVLQVFSAEGVPLAYVKVGWNDWARQAVGREAAALQSCLAHPMRLGVPAFLGLSSWRGLDLLVTGPLPGNSSRIDAAKPPPLAAVVREISALGRQFTGELISSPWWRGIRSRIQDVGDESAASALADAANTIERTYGQVPMTFGAWHGDLVPWNLARSGSRLYAWDWEYSMPCVPLGFDAVHFHFQVAFVSRQLPLDQAVALAADRAADVLRKLGLPAPVRPLISALHVLELAIRHEEARVITGDADERFYPAVTDVLACPHGLLASHPTGRAA